MVRVRLRSGLEQLTLCSFLQICASYPQPPTVASSKPKPAPAPPSGAAIDTIEQFPILQRHIGTWEGTYMFIDPDTGKVVDRHRCKLEIGELFGCSGWCISRESGVGSERTNSSVRSVINDPGSRLQRQRAASREPECGRLGSYQESIAVLCS